MFKKALPDTCRRWLVRGNHDSRSISWYLSQGWDVVCDAIDLQVYGTAFRFTHQCQDVPEGVVNVHGHLHDNPYPEDFSATRHILVSCERSRYSPVCLKKLKES